MYIWIRNFPLELLRVDYDCVVNIVVQWFLSRHSHGWEQYEHGNILCLYSYCRRCVRERNENDKLYCARMLFQSRNVALWSNRPWGLIVAYTVITATLLYNVLPMFDFHDIKPFINFEYQSGRWMFEVMYYNWAYWFEWFLVKNLIITVF